MSVQTYKLSKDGNKKLSDNFRVREFRCHDGSDKILIDDKLVLLLQKLRGRVGKPIIINSSYRTITWNKKQGGSPTSQHLKGKAADIKIEGLSPTQVKNLAIDVGFDGVGIYDTFVHVDVRGWKSYFDKRVKK